MCDSFSSSSSGHGSESVVTRVAAQTAYARMPDALQITNFLFIIFDLNKTLSFVASRNSTGRGTDTIMARVAEIVNPPNSHRFFWRARFTTLLLQHDSNMRSFTV